MINWSFFPRSNKIPEHLVEVVDVFKANYNQIESPKFDLKSNKVLEIISGDLEQLEFKVEKSKAEKDKIIIPVLFGDNGYVKKGFEADAYCFETQTVIEVEAGRGYLNHQFLKDLFQACMMNEVEYLVIAIRNMYKKNNDYDKVQAFFDTLYTNGRLKLPLKGVLIVGY